jgi:hypothetical protein
LPHAAALIECWSVAAPRDGILAVHELTRDIEAQRRYLGVEPLAAPA